MWGWDRNVTKNKIVFESNNFLERKTRERESRVFGKI